MNETPMLTVYSRRGCHLCEDLLAELETWLRGRARIEVIDVDTDSALREAYGLRVPVVSASGSELCHYHLDRSAVQSWLNTH